MIPKINIKGLLVLLSEGDKVTRLDRVLRLDSNTEENNIVDHQPAIKTYNNIKTSHNIIAITIKIGCRHNVIVTVNKALLAEVLPRKQS